jgi:HD-GYP domain-containing protein (c-di-GMP phosphodiesterase class II)
MMLAEQARLSDDERSELSYAPLRKYAGCCKLAVSNAILDKPGKFTGAGFARVERHPGIPHEVLERVASFRGVVEVDASHHEKPDGSGYHRGLSTGNLSPHARILAVAEIFDALSRDRQYRLAMPMEKALSILERERDVQVRSRTAA